MMILDLIATTIESFIFSFTTLSYFGIKDNKWKCLLLTILCIAETYIFNNILVNNVLLITSMTLTLAVFLMLETKKITLAYFVIPILLFVDILICNALAIFIVSSVGRVDITEMSSNLNLWATTIVVSRLFIIASALIFLRIFKKGNGLVEIKKFWIYLPFIAMIAIMFTTLTEAIMYQTVSLDTIYQLLVELVILIFNGILLFIAINKQIKENFQYQQRLLEEDYQLKLSKLVQQSLDRISKDKHMMIYTLMNIKNQMNNSKEINYIIDQEINKYFNFKFISSTGNSYFDYEVTNKIQELNTFKIKLKVLFNINEKNPLLNEEIIVSYLIDCLNSLKQHRLKGKEIMVSLEEKEEYLIFKITVPDKERILFNKISNVRKYEVDIKEEFALYSFLIK